MVGKVSSSKSRFSLRFTCTSCPCSQRAITVYVTGPATGQGHQALSTEHGAASTEHPAPSTQHSAWSTEHPAPSWSTQHRALSTERVQPHVVLTQPSEGHYHHPQFPDEKTEPTNRQNKPSQVHIARHRPSWGLNSDSLLREKVRGQGEPGKERHGPGRWYRTPSLGQAHSKHFVAFLLLEAT